MTSGFKQPTDMEGYLSNAMSALEKAEKIPKALIKGCSGLLLMSSKEFGFGLSSQGGAGVLIARKDGKWSPPVAMQLQGLGVGAVVGLADHEMVVVLGRFATTKLVEGDFQIKMGLDAGFAAGKLGGDFGAEIAVSNKGGFGTSYVYSWNKGVLFSAQFESCMISMAPKPNLGFYGKPLAKDIIDGKGKVPESETYTALMDGVEKLLEWEPHPSQSTASGTGE